MEYNAFVQHFAQYVLSHPISRLIDRDQPMEDASFMNELSKVIISYLYCMDHDELLLCDISAALPLLGKNDKINCIATYPRSQGQMFDSSIWFTINSHVLTYHPDTDSFSKILHRMSKKKARISLEDIKLHNIRQIFITDEYRIIVIANDGYLHDNILLGAGSNCMHWDQFQIINRGYQNLGYRGRYHYITCELLGLLKLLWIGSVCEICFTRPHEMVRMQLYQYDDANWPNDICHNMVTFEPRIDVIEGIKNNGHGYKFCQEINEIFDMKQHILFLYCDNHWILYIPIKYYTSKRTEIWLKNKSKTTSNVHNIKMHPYSLYRKTNDYVLYRSGNEKHVSFMEYQLLPFSTHKVHHYFDGFDAVLNDEAAKRYLVTKNSKVFAIQYEDIFGFESIYEAEDGHFAIEDTLDSNSVDQNENVLDPFTGLFDDVSDAKTNQQTQLQSDTFGLFGHCRHPDEDPLSAFL
eukprot:309468_1